MRLGISNADKELARAFGVTNEAVAAVRRRLVSGVHYEPCVRGLEARPLRYTEVGREAVRERLLAGLVDLPIVTLCKNRTWVKVAVPGEAEPRAVQVRNSRGLRRGMTLRCCVLEHEIENLDRNQIPRDQIYKLPN